MDNQLLRSCIDFVIATALAVAGDAASAWTRAASGLVSEAIEVSLSGARAALDLPAPARER